MSQFNLSQCNDFAPTAHTGMNLTDGDWRKVVVGGREGYGGEGKAEAVRFGSTFTTAILGFPICIE